MSTKATQDQIVPNFNKQRKAEDIAISESEWIDIIKEFKLETTSAKIRYLIWKEYRDGSIARFLGIRPQFVNNVRKNDKK